MPLMTPTNDTVTQFKGLHLYHAPFSNCSMRVRIALAEKELDWTSHIIDLSKGEQRTAEYLGINPNGVVPTLVDNGKVIIDSADIIDYLDTTYLLYSLRPKGEMALKEMYEWMYLARDIHLSIKTYMYYKMDATPLTKDELDDYRRKQTYDKKLLEFHEHRSQEGFSKEDIIKAKKVIDSCFVKMDNRLQDNEWLTGDKLSLADITWIPQLIVLKRADYPFDKYAHFERWKNAIVSRPSFQKGVSDWL